MELYLLHKEAQAFALHFEGVFQSFQFGVQCGVIPFLLELLFPLFECVAELFFGAFIALRPKCGPLVDGIREQLVFAFQYVAQRFAVSRLLQLCCGPVRRPCPEWRAGS